MGYGCAQGGIQRQPTGLSLGMWGVKQGQGWGQSRSAAVLSLSGCHKWISWLFLPADLPICFSSFRERKSEFKQCVICKSPTAALGLLPGKDKELQASQMCQVAKKDALGWSSAACLQVPAK